MQISQPQRILKMRLSDDIVEVVSATYTLSKAYIKESDLETYAEEFVRNLIEVGFDYESIADELHEFDEALADAIDNLADEFSEEEW